ncbi:MAG: T9SS type A sorting domain-containing protein [Bacteroidota bacterium]
MKTYKYCFLLISALVLLMFSSARAQFFQQGGKLVGAGAVNNFNGAEQGHSVSLSADGNTAIVGGATDNNYVGAVWVYTRSAGVWTQQGAKLVGTGAVGNSYQGYSVSLSADGNTAIVGGFGDSIYAGAAWVYTRSGGVWTQQGNKLVGTGAALYASQGSSVSLSADGNTAIVGGYGDSNNIGAVWVFTRSGGTWTQQGSKLIGTGAVGGAAQGVSVSISADGNTALVGGEGDNNGIGATWTFTRNGGVWSQLGSKLVGTGGVGYTNQGISVAISGDGTTIMVGGNRDSTVGNAAVGAVWSYYRNILSPSGWSQIGNKIVGTGAAGTANQGTSVSLSYDGSTAIVGGYLDNFNYGFFSGVGAAWVFNKNLVSGFYVWSQRGNKLVGGGAVGLSRQGFSVSISADGNTAFVGGIGDNNGAGAAWVYSNVGSPVITAISDIPNDQGGRVGIKWNKSPYDNALSNPQVTSYSIWRALPGSQASSSTTNPGFTIINSAMKRLRHFNLNGVDTYWEWIADQPAHLLPDYDYAAPTLSDSTSPVNNGMTQFFVSAQTNDQNIFYDSNPDSGYSVDNIPPVAPRNLAYSVRSDTVVLHWNPNSEPDLGRYVIYRSADSITDLSLLHSYAYSRDTAFIDNAPPQKAYYLVCAQDIHNNLSPPSNQVLFGITGVSEYGKGIPVMYELYQNYPNPFNPTTVINYAIPEQSFVRLTIYNVLGQEVATLVNGVQYAGNKSVEFDASKIPSGMYFYKVTAGKFSDTKKMILLK